MQRFFARFLAFLALAWSLPAAAEVELSFHSYSGSIFGRYPHALIVMKGRLDANGQAIDENYGFTAKTITTAILRGPVEHDVIAEKPEYVRKTNRHFSVTLSDAQYWRIRQEVDKWRSAPGKFYDLEKRNCIHFVGAMAQIVGLKVNYPDNMLRRPQKWLNHITGLNPQLGARPIR